MEEDSQESKLKLGTEDPLTDWKNEPDILALKSDLESAQGSHDAQLRKIKEWRDQLNTEGRYKAPKIQGRSQVQPKLIRKQAEWRYPSLSEPFLSSDKIYSIEPVTYADKESAQQNELVLNWQIRTKLNFVNFIDDYVRSVVDEGTVIVRTGWLRTTKEVEIDAPKFRFIGASSPEEEEMVGQAIQASQSDPSTFEETADPALKATVDLYQEEGRLAFAEQVGTEKTTIEEVVENRPTLEVVDPENIYIDPSCGGDFNNALFIVFSFQTNKAELEKQGDRYKNLDQINWDQSDTESAQYHSSDNKDNFSFKDTARRKVVAYEYWGFYDIHDTGELVPIVATWIGHTMVRMEENPYPDQKLPFVIVPYLPSKREMYGEPDAELLGDNQAIMGAITRGMIDLMGRSANAQHGFAKGMLDPLNRRRYDKGNDYEFNPQATPHQSLIEHKYPEIPQSALAMLSLQNNDAESITGVKAFSQGISSQSYGDVATGIRSAIDAAGKREMSILRRLVQGVKEIGTKIISMNSEFLSEEEVVRVTDEEFVAVSREKLQGNVDLKVDLATAEVDNQKANDLGYMLQTMGPNMDPKVSNKILADIARLKNMPALAKQLEEYEPEPDPMAQKLQELEIKEKELDIMLKQTEIQLNTAKAQAEMAESQESQAGVEKTRVDTQRILSELQESISGMNHAKELDKAKAQADGNKELEITKSLLKPQKEGETPPDISAALGYNQMTK